MFRCKMREDLADETAGLAKQCTRVVQKSALCQISKRRICTEVTDARCQNASAARIFVMSEGIRFLIFQHATRKQI